MLDNPIGVHVRARGKQKPSIRRATEIICVPSKVVGAYMMTCVCLVQMEVRSM